MSSFSKMAVWPVGYFRAISSWVLRNRRDVASRIEVINAEVARIGFVKVTYRLETTDGSTEATEERIGFSVTPGSSLSRLVQAYIAGGGNPLDISMFMYPDSREVVERDADGNLKVVAQYPHGGILAPMGSNSNEPIAKPGVETGFGPNPGGFIRSDRYYPARQGGRKSRGAFDSNTIVKTMHQIRSWANQDIKERLQDIEWRIIKLCDLREQLIRERDEVIVQAFGGVMAGVEELDKERFDPNMLVQNLVQDMYKVLYETNEDGSVQGYRANQSVPFLEFTFSDLPSNIESMGG